MGKMDGEDKTFTIFVVGLFALIAVFIITLYSYSSKNTEEATKVKLEEQKTEQLRIQLELETLKNK